jgi:hypothetical protein
MFSALAEGHANIYKKINLFIAMAPVVYLGKSNDGFLKKVSPVA